MQKKVQAILGANSIIFVFFGLKYLNIADSIVIGTSAPVFVTLFAFLFLGERCGLFPVLTALLALLGVGIISKPPIITGAESLSEETMVWAYANILSIYTTQPVIMNFFYSHLICVKHAKNNQIDYTIIFLFFVWIIIAWSGIQF